MHDEKLIQWLLFHLHASVVSVTIIYGKLKGKLIDFKNVFSLDLEFLLLLVIKYKLPKDSLKSAFIERYQLSS